MLSMVLVWNTGISGLLRDNYPIREKGLGIGADEKWFSKEAEGAARPIFFFHGARLNAEPHPHKLWAVEE